jgi:hypothetical protein
MNQAGPRFGYEKIAKMDRNFRDRFKASR